VPTTVAYAHSFAYFVDEFSGKSFPGLDFHVSLPEQNDPSADVRAYLDSEAEYSVFDGSLIVSTLEIDLMAGREVRLSVAAGLAITARIHRLNLRHPQLGRFTLDAAISTVPIARNLLGRDFFQHLQIGFREFHQTFLIATAP
jgi:hypothetical protein